MVNPPSQLTNVLFAGFRLECDGLWLAKEGPPSELFTLEFQPSNAVPGDGTSAAWQHSLELFQRRGNITEIGTIFDRLPLEKVIYWVLTH